MTRANKILATLGAAILVSACGATPAVSLAPLSAMPELVLQQDKHVQEAYRFAAAHPEDLETIPCYCGCVGLGHRNNRECYLKPSSTPDALVFDDHALACQICADITHLTMDLLETGASPEVIRTAVDSKFGERGPGTNTPHPQHQP